MNSLMIELSDSIEKEYKNMFIVQLLRTHRITLNSCNQEIKTDLKFTSLNSAHYLFNLSGKKKFLYIKTKHSDR